MDISEDDDNSLSNEQNNKLPNETKFPNGEISNISLLVVEVKI